MTTTYRVTGMTCGGCARGLTNAFGRVAPDLKVSVSHDTGTVVVQGEHAEAIVREAVEAAGFDFAGRLAPQPTST